GVVSRIVSCGLFAVIQLGGGVVPPKRLCELSGWPPEEEDFWNDVKIEKELINEEVCMDIEWNLLNLDCSLYPSTSKVTFDKKSQMDALEVLDISRTQKAKEFVNKVSSKLGLKRTQKHSLTPPNKHARLSDNESEANASTSEDSEDDSLLDDNTERDLKNMTYDEFVKGFKNESNESNWKLKNGRRIIDVLTENVARVSTIFSGKSKKERTPYIRSVIRLGFSSIVDLSSEFQDGMYTWFEDDWHDIKKKVYETIDMVPKPFEDNVKTIIDTVEEMCNSYHYIDARDYLYKLRLKGESLKIRQIATIYFHVIDKFLEDPYIFMDKIGKPRGLSEIEYVMNMTAPILDDVFSDVKSLVRLHWGDTKSSAIDEHRRKIDMRIVCINQDFELSHVECAKAPTPCKAVNDRSKCLRTHKCILDKFLQKDFSDEVAKDSTIIGVQFAGLEGQIIGIDLLDDGLYFGLEGAQFNFPAQLSNIECLRDALQTLYFFKVRK
ncbi:4488_t:CDS:2, partial [Gigaspora rosea]